MMGAVTDAAAGDDGDVGNEKFWRHSLNIRPLHWKASGGFIEGPRKAFMDRRMRVPRHLGRFYRGCLSFPEAWEFPLVASTALEGFVDQLKQRTHPRLLFALGRFRFDIAQQG